METSSGNGATRVRILGLGNEILGDDAFGILVAREVERLYPGCAEVVCSSTSGLSLLDYMLGASRLVVVDTVVTGAAQPGTLRIFRADQFSRSPGVAPHLLGLFEVLDLARSLQLDAPREAVIVAVEAADCITIGGEMHPDVRAAIAEAVSLAKRLADQAPVFEISPI
jgi:hydrogenase maturation protease